MGTPSFAAEAQKLPMVSVNAFVPVSAVMLPVPLSSNGTAC